MNWLYNMLWDPRTAPVEPMNKRRKRLPGKIIGRPKAGNGEAYTTERLELLGIVGVYEYEPIDALEPYSVAGFTVFIHPGIAPPRVKK